MGFLAGSDGTESVCSSGDPGLIPESGRSPGDGGGYPVQYSCLEHPMDRGAWWATVHRLAKSQTRLKRLSRAQCQGRTKPASLCPAEGPEVLREPLVFLLLLFVHLRHCCGLLCLLSPLILVSSEFCLWPPALSGHVEALL